MTSTATVRLSTAAGEAEAYLASPETPEPAPGVVVLHDVVGLGTDARRQVDWLAEHGFVAIAPDLFNGGSLLRCLRSTMRDYSRREGRVFDLVEAARATLLERSECTGRIAVMGFCLGGDFALLMAPGGTYQAASINYARVPADADVLLAESCPVVASYGGRDRTLQGAAGGLQRVLTDAGVPHDVTEYPRAGHAFMNEHPDGELPVLLSPLGLVSRAGYDDVAASLARQRIIAFLRQHLAAVT